MARPTELARVLGLGDLIAVVLGTVIGSGIFILPGVVMAEVGGHASVSTAVWVIGGALSIMGALTFGELGAMAPEAGGLYVYVRDAFGPFLAFLFGWTQFLVIASGSVAVLAVATRDQLGALVPLTPLAAKLTPAIVIAGFSAINVFGTRKSAGVQAFGVATKVGAIVVMAVALLLVAGHGARGGGVPEPLPPMSGTELLSGVGLALVATLWAYEGWAYVTYSAGEARDPQRNFAKGIFIGTFGVVLLYLIANIAYVHALGPEAMARSGNHVAAEAVTVTFGPAARVLIVLVAEVAVCSALNSIILTAPRIYYAMARDGLFFKRLADVHPRFGTPATAIIASGVWAMVLATGGYVQLITYVTGAAWVFYGLGAATIFWYRRNRPNVPRPFRVPGYPITPGLFTLAAVAIVLDVAITTPLRAAASLGVIGLGALVYPIWKRQGVAPSLET
jgi:basic amino acid/polyamine antiporter, APA family